MFILDINDRDHLEIQDHQEPTGLGVQKDRKDYKVHQDQLALR